MDDNWVPFVRTFLIRLFAMAGTISLLSSLNALNECQHTVPCLDWLLKGAGCLEVGIAATREISEDELRERLQEMELKKLADQEEQKEKAPIQEQASEMRRRPSSLPPMQPPPTYKPPDTLDAASPGTAFPRPTTTAPRTFSDPPAPRASTGTGTMPAAAPGVVRNGSLPRRSDGGSQARTMSRASSFNKKNKL